LEAALQAACRWGLIPRGDGLVRFGADNRVGVSLAWMGWGERCSRAPGNDDHFGEGAG
jgi:hypothetical protein